MNMDYTPRLEQFLKVLRRWKFLSRRIVTDLWFANDSDGSVTRDFMR